MINSGDVSVHFTKVKPMQLAEIRSVLQKRPKGRFSVGLSPEAQEAMAQVTEETKIQQASKRGKRGSKGNVLFADTVQIHHDKLGTHSTSRRPSVSDIFEDQHLDLTYSNHYSELLDNNNDEYIGGPDSPRRHHGRRRSSVSQWLAERRGSVSNGVSAVDIVQSANRVVSEIEEDIIPKLSGKSERGT
ncbi:uncharacterized protein LOC101859951 [Aplysia californica]|uniref:Uncharacterized protein LOC101859951 n=1 Tax=Aplysia californica TaxID=6500 RepID=A0ABM0JW69_APLCA|nr:uncharacterized protein LOC101859951 [Aplysia californica]